MGKLVTQTEFAELIGVSKQAVHKVLKRGDRLVKSVIDTDDGIRIDVVDGVLEWFLNGDSSHDRGGHMTTEAGLPRVDGIMSLSESNAMIRHYTGLLRQLKYSKAAKLLMPAEKYQQEAAEFARTTRDRLLYLPQSMVPFIISALRGMHTTADCDQDRQKAIDVCADSIRRELKTEITKALRDVASSLSAGA